MGTWRCSGGWLPADRRFGGALQSSGGPLWSLSGTGSPELSWFGLVPFCAVYMGR